MTHRNLHFVENGVSLNETKPFSMINQLYFFMFFWGNVSSFKNEENDTTGYVVSVSIEWFQVPGTLSIQPGLGTQPA